MKQILLIAVLSTFIMFSCNTTQKVVQETTHTTMQKTENIKYPITRKSDNKTDYFGTTVADPYRWLEDDMSDETAEWVKTENKLTFDYLANIPYREQIKNRLEKLWNYEKIGTPFKRGENQFFYKNDGLQNQYVLYKQLGDGESEVFLDPNTFSEDGTISLGAVSFSKDGHTVAYSISEGGSDWRKVIIMDVATKKIKEDTLIDIKFSGLSWKGNDGFYYSSYEKPEGSELSAKTDQHRLFYHKLGQKQTEDKIIFGDKVKRRYVGGSVTEDDRYLFISGSESTSGNELYIMDLENPSKGMVQILDHFDSDTYVIENEGSKLFLVTNLNAPNKKIVTVDASNPTPNNWVDLIPETENVLSPSTAYGYLFTTYMVDAVSKVLQYDYSGKLIREVKLPGVGTAGGFGSKKDDSDIYFSFANYTTPGTTYKYDAKTGDYKEFRRSKIDFNGDLYESKQVFYTSKDGTKIPMILSYKKGMKMDGTNPTILYGYGGFNISLKPYFSLVKAIWMEMGGIYVVANLRGGGEYGKDWHDAGTQLKKQNVFDDFIAAGEYLINNNYTSSDYLAIQGGSNGGLLVGATLLQRPDLVKVALPAVGVLDMLRYHTFTAGAGWSYDYGTSEDSKEMFDYLLGYSPVHNVMKGVQYPATLITTGDHDDRVVPAHSFKFAAALQAKQTGPNPTMIRIETNAGHGAGTPVSKTIEQYADIYGFTLWNMGIKKIY